MATKAKKPAKAKAAAQKAAPAKAQKPAPKAKPTAAKKKPSPSKKPDAKKPIAEKKTVSKKTVAPKPVTKKPAPKKTVPNKSSAVKPAAMTAAPVKTKPAPKPVAINLPPLIKKAVKPIKLNGWLSKQQSRLLHLKDELLDAMNGVARDTLRTRAEGSDASGFGMHTGDAGSDAYDRDFALSLLSQERDSLFEIDAALKKIQDGTYGLCEISGKQIPTLALRPCLSLASPSSAKPSSKKPTVSTVFASRSLLSSV